MYATTRASWPVSGRSVRLVVRVGQEADVEDEVGVARGPVLEPEALERDREPGRGRAREELVGDLAPQHVRLEAGRVDDDVGAILDRLEDRALGRDALGHARPRGGRVTAPGLLVAGEQRLLVGVEEQHAVAQAQRRRGRRGRPGTPRSSRRPGCPRRRPRARPSSPRARRARRARGSSRAAGCRRRSSPRPRRRPSRSTSRPPSSR